MEKFKYKTYLQANIKPIPKPLSLSSKELKASLDELKTILPDEDFVKANDDLLFVAFNLFTANLANKNHDLVLTDDAITMAKNSQYRFADIEHNRYHVIGALVDHAFSSYPDNKIIKEDTLTEGSLFNVAASAVVWRHVSPYLSEAIEESADESSFYYELFSASFEVGFNNYWIAKGSPNAASAEILKEEADIEKYKEHLVCNGGMGYSSEGEPLYRIPRECKLLGFGFVEHPAGSVKGLVSGWKPKKQKKKDLAASVPEKIKPKSVIKVRHINTMVDIDNLTQDELQASNVSDIRKTFQKAIKEASDDYKKQVADREAELEAKSQEAKELKSSLEKLSADLAKMQALEAQRQQDDTFQMRMREISDEVELADPAKKVVASAIKTLSDEEFKTWKADFIAMLASQVKTPEALENPEKSANEQLEKTSVEAHASVPNNGFRNTYASESFSKGLKERFKVGKGVKLNTFTY